MKITLLGTGDAFSSDGRASTSILIDGSVKILLDCSPQAIHSLRKINYAINNLEYVFITHLHGDHAGGLPLLVLNLMHKEQGEIYVSGPEGLEDFINSTYSKFYGIGDWKSVVKVKNLSNKFPFEFEYMEGKHSIKDYIYKIKIDGKEIVYTGDTSRVDLSRFAKGVDYLFHEAADLNQDRAQKYGHTTPFQAAEVAKEADVKNLVLVHRPYFDKTTQNEVKKIFANTKFPNDLETFS